MICRPAYSTLDIGVKWLKIFFGKQQYITEFLDIVFDGKEDYRRAGARNTLKHDFTLLLNSLKVAHEVVHRKTDIENEEDAWLIQDELDVFCFHFVNLFGGQAVTNYIWIWMSGVLVPFFIEYGCMSKVQLQVSIILIVLA